MAEKRDYYKVLGVKRGAGEDEIRSAYKKLARQNHPDLNPDDKQAEARFKEISESYAVLSNSEARKKYDAFGHRGSGAQGFDFSGFDFRNMRGGFSAEGENFHGSFGDILSELLGGRSGRGGRRRAPQGGDPFGAFGPSGAGARPGRGGGEVRLKLKIDFDLAAKGGVTQIQFSNGGQTAKVATRIPAGVDTGQTIRLKGKSPGGGDLLIEIEVGPHAVFTRDGLNLRCTVPITIAEAVLGEKIPVPTLDGEATITIPAGTQGGQTLRLRGRGIRKSDKQSGDLFVTVQIAVPKNIDEKSKALIRTFDKENKIQPRNNAG